MKKSDISIEVDINETDINTLYVISKIEMNIVTFEKFKTVVNMSDNNGKKIITLLDSIGSEKYEVVPEVNLDLVGKVGNIVKCVHGKLKNKKKKKLMIDKIVWVI